MTHPSQLRAKAGAGAGPLEADSSVRGNLRAAADRAADSGASQAAIPARILRQILLVIVLGIVEPRCLVDLGGNCPLACRGELGLVGALRFLRGLTLLGVGDVDDRPVLRT